MDRDSEIALAARINSGDENAFEELVETYKNMIYRLALQSCQNPEDASDICQDVFLKIYRSISGFEGKSALSTWIWRIATNVCVDYARRNQPLKKNISLTVDDCDDESSQWELPDFASDPARLYEQKDLGARIDAAIEKLPPASREIIRLRDVDGLKYEEIAALLGIELGTVRSRLARARLRLRSILIKDWEIY